jgi:luciferase family oxidoreductase group 1
MKDSSTLCSKLTIPFSVLDLVPILSGSTPASSFENTLKLARNCEKFGYSRYWMAEHHNMAGIASSATSILISHVAAGTNSIRVGSGGIMLPNHAPLVIAEQFGTLESLFPGRIDLGLGRAPGTDQLTAMALRRNNDGAGEDFAKSLMELRTYLSSSNSDSAVRAIPGEGLDIPIWLLGSSTYSAQLAGILGLPFAFASHFAPAQLFASLNIYRESFKPSDSLKEPYSMACLNVVAADTDAEAEFMASSLFIAFLNVIRGKRKSLSAPVSNMDMVWNEAERFAVMQMLKYTFIGSGRTIQSGLSEFILNTEVNEIMINSHIFDQEARIRSYEIISELFSGENRSYTHKGMIDTYF